MSHILILQNRLTPPPRWRWPLAVLAALLSGILWTGLAFLIESQSLPGVWTLLGREKFGLTALFLALWVLGLTLLCNSLFAGNLMVGLVVVILSFVNYFKVLITMIPLLLADFSLIGQAASIAGLNSSSLILRGGSVQAIAAGTVWLVLCLFFSRPLRLNWTWSALVWAPLCALALHALFWLGAEPLVYPAMGADINQAMSQATANSACGVPLGLWRAFYCSRNRRVSEEYSPEYMEEVLAQTQDYANVPRGEEGRQPHIILILSESFYDITQIDGLSFPEDPIAGFHALQEEGVSGKFGSRGFGYGTCDIELEVLTGINSGLLDNEPENSWPKEYFSRLPAVPALLQSQGYYTSMVHMYNDSVYNRGEYFGSLGFQDIYFCEDFAEIYPPAAQAENYNEYMISRKAGPYFSDDLLSDLLIAQFEARAGEGPVFLYGSSMGNHTPYPLDKFRPEEMTVTCQSGLTGEAAEHFLVCTQGLHNASEALVKLTDYFRDREEPVVIVFYGDHLAGLGLSTGGTAYSALGLAPWSMDGWALEDYAHLYTTDYLIWSNDPSYLPGDPGSRYDTGCHYLGSQLLELAGSDLPLYWRLIYKLSQTRVVDSANYHLSRGGELSSDPPGQGSDGLGLSLLTHLLYDATYGKQYVTEQLWEIP